MRLITGNHAYPMSNSFFCVDSASISVYSGGGIFHTGGLHIANASFVGNQAGEDGLAIFSLGPLITTLGLAFSKNTLHCPQGTYGYDISADDVRDIAEITDL